MKNGVKKIKTDENGVREKSLPSLTCHSEVLDYSPVMLTYYFTTTHITSPAKFGDHDNCMEY